MVGLIIRPVKVETLQKFQSRPSRWTFWDRVQEANGTQICVPFFFPLPVPSWESDLISMLAFKQSFSSSRPSNGFMKALKVIPKKTLPMYMEAGAGKSLSGGIRRGYGTMKSSIEKKLQEGLLPTMLVVDDVSHQHAGHAGVEKGATETHFNVKVVSDKFTGSSLIKRHRLVYDLLDNELKNGVHALSLVTKSPSEPV